MPKIPQIPFAFEFKRNQPNSNLADLWSTELQFKDKYFMCPTQLTFSQFTQICQNGNSVVHIKIVNICLTSVTRVKLNEKMAFPA